MVISDISHSWTFGAEHFEFRPSHHLEKLKNTDLVSVRCESTFLWCTATEPGSRTIRRGRPSGESCFDPRNLVPRRVADYATWVDIGISFPLNPVTLFAHACNDWRGHGYGHGSIGFGADDQDRAARLCLA